MVWGVLKEIEKVGGGRDLSIGTKTMSEEGHRFVFIHDKPQILTAYRIDLPP